VRVGLADLPAEGTGAEADPADPKTGAAKGEAVHHGSVGRLQRRRGCSEAARRRQVPPHAAENLAKGRALRERA
jgi:hypothetical protein